MSSITFSTASVIPTASTTRLRLTARGRRVLLALAAVPLASGIAFAALSSGAAIASNEHGSAGADFETVTVLPGDTLWSIAEEVAPEADPREVIGAISRLNLLRGEALQIGEELAIPAEFSH